MAKTATYSLIASTTGTGSSNTISFTSIPATYTDLVIVFDGAATTGGTAGFAFTINGVNSGNLYSDTRLQGNGSAASSARNSNQNSGNFGYISSSNRSMFILHIMDYSNTTTFKTTISRSHTQDASDGRVGAYVTLYRATAAVNRVDILATPNFSTTSTFKLYGIQAGSI
jgi:hypothetical protein